MNLTRTKAIVVAKILMRAYLIHEFKKTKITF